MVNALRDAVSYLKEKHGQIDVPWGDIHVIKRGDVILPLEGGDQVAQILYMTHGNTDRKTGFPGEGNKYFCDAGSSFMMITAMKERVETWSIRPYGESEDPESPHFADQTRLFAERKYRKAWFYLDDVLKNLESAKGRQMQDVPPSAYL